jgi:hypothetical protein
MLAHSTPNVPPLTPSGPLASAIITWRNSLVFHSLDKVTSLFIHVYPPVVLTVIRWVNWVRSRPLAASALGTSLLHADIG